jgi:hypothetical protein
MILLKIGAEKSLLMELGRVRENWVLGITYHLKHSHIVFIFISISRKLR